MPGHHDLGGLPAGPLDRRDHELEPWEREIDAVRYLLGIRKLLSPDEMRRTIESLPQEDYVRLTYYERWNAAIANIMIEKGVFSRTEFNRRIAECEERARSRP